ncbi:MAG TPA: glycoside hydrolase family 38 C-terminal domain-containing protein [bacterium]|nr:glycoside hydrolase family 38 C-terminal domain-containing protein [bacterium]
MNWKKLVALTASIIFFSSMASFAAEPEYKDSLGKLDSELSELQDPINTWNYRKKCDSRCFQTDIPKMKWNKAAKGFYWPEANQQFWFRKNYTVPEEVAGIKTAGSKVILWSDVSDGVDVYVDGLKKGALKHGHLVTIMDSAVPGTELTLGMRVWNGTYPGVFLGSYVYYSVFEEIETRIKKYTDKVRSAEVLLKYSDEKDKWISKLNESTSKLDIEALDSRDLDKFYASLDEADAVLDDLGKLFEEYALYLICYSHIDLAWLWDYNEGEQVTYDTLKTVFKLLGEYPEWIYSHSQAHSIKWMEDDYPKIFEELKKWVKEGRIELIGGTWSEHDSNIPSGEGFVRQFLYGKRYFRDKFGIDIKVAWTPDSFGYNWNLPQILVKSGMTGFLTQKLGMNEFTQFPHKLFWWKGPDGSKILTYFPPSGYANQVERLPMISLLNSVKSKHGVNDNMVVYGVGDHGGGLTAGHLDRAFALKNDPTYPKIEFTTAKDYFEHLHDQSKKIEFPVWDDELYLEHHRGTYTSQAQTKKNNRRAEQLLVTTEKLSTIALMEHNIPYPAERIFMPGWYYTLLFHMHDILPGSGIRKVYEDCDRDYAELFKVTNGIVDRTLNTIAQEVNTNGKGLPMFIFNPLSWERDAVIEHEVEALSSNVQVIDGNGNRVPAQLTEKDGVKKVLFIARNLPSLGYAIYRVFPSGGAPGQAPKTDLHAEDGILENSFMKVKYDPRSGHITSLYDKNLKREFLETDKENNILQAYVDTQNAWEIMTDQPIIFDRTGSAKIIENGPVRITIESEHRLNISDFKQYVSLYENSPLVDMKVDVDFQERNTTVKLAFNLDLLNEDTWFEIPYAAISRKAIPMTAADRAKFEVSGHKWVDYTNQDGKAGISLLNDSKYGFDVKQNVLRMSMLRSPTSPDPLADRGKHSIEYALYTHPGDWREADTSRKGYEYNFRPIVFMTDTHPGKLPASRSYFKSEPENVVLNVVKAGEDDGIIIRFVETEGRKADAVITIPDWDIKDIVETNLIEDEIEPTAKWTFSNKRISVPLGPYEIKTLKLKL